MKHKHTIQMGISIGFLIIGIILIILGCSIKPQTWTYAEFSEALEQNKVTEIVITASTNTMRAKTTDGAYIQIPTIYSEETKQELVEQGIVISIDNDYLRYFIPIIIAVIIVAIWACIYLVKKDIRRQQKENPKITTIEAPDVRLDDVVGLEPIKKDVEQLIDFLKRPEVYESVGASMPRGIMLYGPPGTGKTMIAKAIAGEARVPFFPMNGSDFVELFVGQGAKRVRALFKEARKSSPAIIFIDEIDAIGQARTNTNNEEYSQTINALLSELDGFSNKDRILIIGATNRIESLDPALLRAGRFDKKIHVPLPEQIQTRIEIINKYSQNKRMDDAVDINKLAKETSGFSPAQIQSLLNEAVLVSIQAGTAGRITQEAIDAAISKELLNGHLTPIGKRSYKTMRSIAIHEAGHAVVGKTLGFHVEKVTIMGTSTGIGGFNLIYPRENELSTIRDIKNQICVLYAGRIAEKLKADIYDEITIGAESDIGKATDLLHRLVTSMGITETYGCVAVTQEQQRTNRYHDEIKKISDELITETEKILQYHMQQLDTLTDKLIEYETLSGELLEEALQ